MLTLQGATIAAAWNVQGDASRIALALPTVPNTVARLPGMSILWLGPRSWLVLADRVDAQGGVAFDVSASRMAWTLRGERAEATIARHCPLDLRASTFAPGTCAQSLFGRVTALYYRHLAGDAFTVMVARSLARDTMQRLEASMAPYGYALLAPQPVSLD